MLGYIHHPPLEQPWEVGDTSVRQGQQLPGEEGDSSLQNAHSGCHQLSLQAALPLLVCTAAARVRGKLTVPHGHSTRTPKESLINNQPVPRELLQQFLFLFARPFSTTGTFHNQGLLSGRLCHIFTAVSQTIISPTATLTLCLAAGFCWASQVLSVDSFPKNRPFAALEKKILPSSTLSWAQPQPCTAWMALPCGIHAPACLCRLLLPWLRSGKQLSTAEGMSYLGMLS